MLGSTQKMFPNKSSRERKNILQGTKGDVGDEKLRTNATN
jgi:hypothetical protein